MGRNDEVMASRTALNFGDPLGLKMMAFNVEQRNLRHASVSFSISNLQSREQPETSDSICQIILRYEGEMD
jgi:hypothetical protein